MDNLYKNPITLTWWNNQNTPGAGQDYWQQVADDFHALHPTVTISIRADETIDLQHTKIPAAEAAGTLPEIFQVWGGAELVDQVEGGYVQDITAATKAAVAAIGGAATAWAVHGCQYGLPYDFGVEGFWYNKDLFAQAGIGSAPTTIDELNSDVTKLKAIHAIPISVGAGDKWPAAHWWYNFALRECSASTLLDFGHPDRATWSDPCYVKAGQDLQAFIATQPFQDSFIADEDQTVDGSAGLVADGSAAMTLMGPWEGGVMASLAPDRQEPAFLGWFPFPSVAGAGGNQTAQLGSGDGFACRKDAPPECVEFLKYLDSVDVQTGFAATGVGIPVVKGAEVGLTDPALKTSAIATQQASAVQLWLDTFLGSGGGTALNDAIVTLFAGTGQPRDVPAALKQAFGR
ncbi:MAG TPA: extracellular solute-binding protein [Micromonosporaceae bacterium]